MPDRLVLTKPVRQPVRKQTAAERQAVYDYVTARDKTCRAPVIGSRFGMSWPAECQYCTLTTEDPDAFFVPRDWAEDSGDDRYECPTSPTGFHEALPFAPCSGNLERHHAGIKLGSNRNRLTDARHVVLLCRFHHRTWAPTHSRLILEWLAEKEHE